MNCIEHYFENLLTMGADIKGEPNKNALSKEVQEAIEICADYTKYNQFHGQYLTKNCIACKYDETEEEDGEHCKKCLAGDNQFELDKEFVQPITKNDLVLIHTEGLDEEIRCTMCTNSIKSDRGCDGNCVVNNAMYKKVMDVIENHIADTDKMIESTTKNDLGVDKTFYEQIVEYCNEHFLVLVEKDVWEDARKALTTKNDLGVDCISRKAVIDELKRYFHNEYYQRTSIQDCRDCFIEDVLNHLPSVTPQEPRKDEVILTKEEYGELVSNEFDNGYAKGYREALEQEPRWIPVSEYLPVTNDEVLVTYIVNGNTKKRYVETANCFDGEWSSVNDEYRIPNTKIEIIAWCEMPKPYREVEE